MTTDAGRLLERYDTELREAGEVDGMGDVRRIGPLWTAKPSPTTGFVTHASLAGVAEAEVAELVAAVLEWSRRDELAEIEWKTRGHDATPGLSRLLTRAGFAPEDTETVVAGDLEALAGDVSVVGVSLRRAGSAGSIRDDVTRVASLHAAVFGHDVAGIVERTLVRLERGATEVWLAEDDVGGDLVGAGRYDIVPGTSFAGLWGGAVHRDWRGRGVYRALTRARAGAAMVRGASSAYADCTELSRPILERCGLVRITTTTPYVRRG